MLHSLLHRIFMSFPFFHILRRPSQPQPLSSQQQTALHRGLEQARKIRMRLGGGVDLLEPFPARPKGMHRRTFERLRARAEAALFGSNPSAR